MTQFLLGADLGQQGTLEWTSPDWVILLAAVLATAALLLAWRGERSVGARLGELALWGSALAGLVVGLAGPMWIEEEGRTEEARVVVLVDASRSMGILEEGEPRHEQAKRVLQEVLDQEPDAEVFHFGDDLMVGSPSTYLEAGTDLEGALDALGERLAGERLAAVVVITDGLDRGLLRRRFQRDGDQAIGPEVQGPLTVYQVGSPGALKDLAVQHIDAGGFAFLRQPFTLTASLSGAGYEGQTVQATLLRDDAPLTKKPVTFDEEGLAQVQFEVRPDQAGRFTYEVSVPLLEGDAVPSNNRLAVVVRVVRDKIRVLQVAGAPSWDVKFLRRFLKGDPSVDLVSFFILRTPEDRTNYREEELSLIQFPYQDLFDRELPTFDVVVFQNFDHKPYFRGASPMLLDNLRRYVEEQGRALVMVGGERSFGRAGLGGTPLAAALPVVISNSTPPDPTPFRPALTAEGARHPITRLAADPVENGDWWARLHDLDGTNVMLGAADGATVLLSHPTRTTQSGEPLPILAVKEAGKGRTMALTVDSSWRWSLSEAAEGRGNQAYLRFWKNALRWLMRDQTVARVTVDTPRENYGIGDEVRIVVRARDEGFAPQQGATVAVTLRTPEGEEQLAGTTGPDGDVVFSYAPKTRGSHRIAAIVSAGQVRVGDANTVFAVTSRDPELDEATPDSRFLQWVAAATKGQWVGPGDDAPFVRDPDAARTVLDRRETPLWRAPGLGLWVLLFAGLGWIVRRRAGLR